MRAETCADQPLSGRYKAWSLVLCSTIWRALLAASLTGSTSRSRYIPREASFLWGRKEFSNVMLAPHKENPVSASTYNLLYGSCRPEIAASRAVKNGQNREPGMEGPALRRLHSSHGSHRGLCTRS